MQCEASSPKSQASLWMRSIIQPRLREAHGGTAEAREGYEVPCLLRHGSIQEGSLSSRRRSPVTSQKHPCTLLISCSKLSARFVTGRDRTWQPSWESHLEDLQCSHTGPEEEEGTLRREQKA